MNLELQLQRELHLKTMHENKLFLQRWHEQNKKAHRAAMTIKKQREARDAKVEEKLRGDRERRQKQATMKARERMISDIEQFEVSLKEKSGSETRMETTVLSMTRTIFPDLQGITMKPQEFRQTMKMKRREDVTSRKDRQQRRRRVLLEQQRVFQDIEEARRHDITLHKILRQSNQDRRLDRVLSDTREIKNVIIEHRRIREEEIEHQKYLDKLELERLEMERMKYEIEIEQHYQDILVIEYDKRERERKRLKAERHLAFCNLVTNDIVEISLKHIDYIEVTEGIHPSYPICLQWNRLFVVSDSMSTSEEELQNLQDKFEVDNYLQYKGRWSSDHIEQIKENHILTSTLTKIESVVSPAPVSPSPEKDSAQDPTSSTDAILPQPLDSDMAALFYTEWNSIETIFRESLHGVVSVFRELHDGFLRRYYHVKEKFVVFLQEPHDGPKHVEEFRVSFNEIADDLRSSIEVKRELHKRVEILKVQLYSIVNTRREEADKELNSLLQQEWIDYHRKILSRLFAHLFQLEADRYAQHCRFLADFFYDTNNRPLLTMTNEELFTDVVNPVTDPKQKKRKVQSRKSNRTPTEEIEPTEINIESTFERATAYADQLKTLLQQGSDPKKKDSKKKPKKGEEDSLLIEELSQALSMECVLYSDRVMSLYSTYQRVLPDEVDEKIDYLRRKIEEWIIARHQHELIEVDELISIIRYTIESEKSMPDAF